MSSTFRGHWVLPIHRPPIEHGWIEIDRGVVTTVGEGRPPGRAEDLGEVAILPGLVNAHTHLELSGLAGRVPPASSMVAWIRTLLGVRGRTPSAGGASIDAPAAMQGGVAAARAAGTATVGDISNTLEVVPRVAEAGLRGVVFHEILGFNAPDPDARVIEAWKATSAKRTSGVVSEILPAETTPDVVFADVVFSVVAHAPYSVSPALFAAIARHRRSAPLTVHAGESAAEIEFLETGQGPFRGLLEDLGAWTPAWRPPGCDPVEYLDRCGYLGAGCLVVHGTHLARPAIERLRARDAVLVTCPRSNRWVGEGDPPLEMFYASGVRVAIGTDSLASVETLSLFDELARARVLAPRVAASRLIDSATRVGAEALGCGAQGMLAPGHRAPVLAVGVPPDTTDVEEYLVSGVPSRDVTWIGGRS